MAKCEYCGASPVEKPTTILYRMNEKGVAGVWLCKDCQTPSLETIEETGRPHYLHGKECPNYCDYACNGDGFTQAEHLAEAMGFSKEEDEKKEPEVVRCDCCKREASVREVLGGNFCQGCLDYAVSQMEDVEE